MNVQAAVAPIRGVLPQQFPGAGLESAVEVSSRQHAVRPRTHTTASMGKVSIVKKDKNVRVFDHVEIAELRTEIRRVESNDCHLGKIFSIYAVHTKPAVPHISQDQIHDVHRTPLLVYWIS